MSSISWGWKLLRCREPSIDDASMVRQRAFMNGIHTGRTETTIACLSPPQCPSYNVNRDKPASSPTRPGRSAHRREDFFLRVEGVSRLREGWGLQYLREKRGRCGGGGPCGFQATPDYTRGGGAHAAVSSNALRFSPSECQRGNRPR